jgi:hypothetical protein
MRFPASSMVFGLAAPGTARRAAPSAPGMGPVAGAAPGAPFERRVSVVVGVRVPLFGPLVFARLQARG